MQPDQWRALARMADRLARRFHLLDQAKKTARGAWRQPELVSLVSGLEGELKSAYDACERGIAWVLAGRSDTGGLGQADAPTPGDAVRFYGLPDEAVDEPGDPNRLADALLLLGAFRAQQLDAAGRAIEAAFGLGRTQLLKRLGREGAAQQSATIALLPQMTARFEADAQRLYRDLLDGSKRVPDGVKEIADDYETVGAQLAVLRHLFRSEEFRLSLFAEHAVWWSWISGFRAAAVDASVAAAIAGEPLPQFEWAGPNDSKICVPCKGRFTNPIVTAASLADLPMPSDICAFGNNCRHHWRLVG